MKLCKQSKGAYRKREDYFVNRTRRQFNLSAAVRDAILPHNYVEVEINGNTITIKPTDTVTEYKLNLGGGQQGRITCCKILNYIQIPENTRLMATLNEDGTITIYVGQKVAK